MILASEAAVSRLKLKPLARVVGYAVVGVEPSIMGIGPAHAIRKLLQQTNKTLNNIDLVEVCDVWMCVLWRCVMWSVMCEVEV